MARWLSAIALALVCAFAVNPAQAKHKRHFYKHHHIARAAITESMGCLPDNDARIHCGGSIQRVHRAVKVTARYDDDGVIGGRPKGCPHAFCGCEASRYVFGEMRPDLYLAANWIRKFPRTSPAPGMAAARNHHVMVLIRYAGGNEWLVHDGNSGRHLTREHIRSISGYVIVNPHGSRMAMR